MTKMNDKQRFFVENYLINFNATKAAIEAGYSENTSYSIGQRLLKNVEIKEIVDNNKGAPMGALMGLCMKALAGKASGKIISDELRKLTS